MFGDGKLSKVESLLLKIFGCLFGSVVVSLFLAVMLSCLINEKTISFAGIGRAFSSTSFMAMFPIGILACLFILLLFFTNGKGGSKTTSKINAS